LQVVVGMMLGEKLLLTQINAIIRYMSKITITINNGQQIIIAIFGLTAAITAGTLLF